MKLSVICASVVFVLAIAASDAALAASLDTEGFKAACVTDADIMPGPSGKATPQAFAIAWRASSRRVR
jgi:hypothetical protein